MKGILLYIAGILLLTSCQHQLHFPETPVVIHTPEKIVTAIVITNPAQTDYDSMAYRYSTGKTMEIHYDGYGDSVTRTYYYDAAGRLSKLEDEKAIYYTNNNMARRISFQYDAGGQLQQTKTDFTNVSGIASQIITSSTGTGKRLIVYDTAYTSTSYNLDWANRIIYSTISSSNYLLYDSGIFINTTTAGLVKTIVSAFSYGTDSSVTSISKRIYFNHQLSEKGIVSATSDRPAPAYQALRKKLYRNLSNWFETGTVWQDDNYHIFPLPGGPYKSILYQGFSTSAGPASPPFTRNYEFENTYNGDQLDNSVVTYSLLGQGTNHYVKVIRFYYTQ
jgi:hypothetical protein